ncbi:MAG: TldD/PmbA family protein [Pseudomonadota bacterium]
MTDHASEDAIDAGPDPQALLSIAENLVQRARTAGADQAEAGISESRSLEASVREGRLEDVERSESRDAGVRVLIGKRQAGVAFSDLSEAGCALAVERAIAMARAAPEDPYCGLVDAAELATDSREIELYEAPDWDVAALERAALRMEDAAMAVPGVEAISSSGASESAAASAVVLSNGFSSARRSSMRGLGIAPIAKRDGLMERDYETQSARRAHDLRSAEEIGRIAGERAAARLGAEKLASGKRPVLFDQRNAPSFLSSLLGAISGPSIARGTSFLRDRLGEPVFADSINVLEDPFRPWSHGARPHDGEGVAVRPRALIENGVLTTWLLNAASARQLDLELTGHGARRLGAPPGVSTANVHLEAGPDSPEALIAGMKSGLIVTEMFGPSLNANTGDWSVGVAGFAVENGERAHPVSEITVAGNLIDMFARLIPASDLEFRGRTNAPSVFIDDLAIGGA